MIILPFDNYKFTEYKFFHESASQRRKTNLTSGLRDSDDAWHEQPTDIACISVDYFHTLFQSSMPAAVEEVVQHVDSVVTPAMNSDLLWPFSHEEIKHSLFQMHPSKAPGPDGMTVLFFQKFWHVVGLDVSNAMLDFLHSSCMLKAINFTHIVLIPKVKAPERMSQFRPISL